MPTVYARTVRRASEIVGLHELAVYLEIPAKTVALWVAGSEEPPLNVFLKAVDIIARQGTEEINGGEKTINPKEKPASE